MQARNAIAIEPWSLSGSGSVAGTLAEFFNAHTQLAIGPRAPVMTLDFK